jgi:hypothetical protein
LVFSGVKLLEDRLCLLRPAAASCWAEPDGGEGLSSGKWGFGASGLVPGKIAPLPRAAAADAAADVLVIEVRLGWARLLAREIVEGAAFLVGFVNVVPFRFLELY